MFIQNFTRMIFMTLSLGVCNAIAQQAAPPDVRPLILGQPIERELKNDEFHSYGLALQSGQFLSVIIEQKGIDVVVTLFDPDSKIVGEVDSPNGMQGPEPFFAITKLAGNYRLEIRSLEKTAPVGRYEVKIRELRTATEKDKNNIAAQTAAQEAYALESQGTAESLRGAINRYEEALPFYRAVDDKGGEAGALTNIGAVYRNLGEKQKALEYYARSLPLFRAVGNRGGEGRTLNNMGVVYRDLGERQKALESYLESLRLGRAVGDKGAEAATLSNIGAVYSSLGERQKALEYYSQALPLLRAIGEGVLEPFVLNNIGVVYGELGEGKKALEYNLQALRLRRANGDKRGEAQSLVNIGAVYNGLGEHQKALEHYAQALPLFRGVGDRAGEALTLSRLGVVYSSLGENQKALEYYAQSLPMLRAVGDLNGEAQTLGDLSSFWKNSKNRRFAVAYGKLSVNNYQRLRDNIAGLDKNVQQTFLRSVEKRYRYLAGYLIADNRLSEAQQVLNLFKDQQFFDFSQGRDLVSLAATAREAEFAEALNQKLETVVTALRALGGFKRGIGKRQPNAVESEQLRSLAAKQTAANDEYLAFLRSAENDFAAPPDEKDKVPAIADLQTMQASLRETSASEKQNTVAVYTLVGEDSYRALVVTVDDIFSVETPIKAADLNKKASDYWSLLKSPKYVPQPSGNELYKIMFAPIEAKLPKGTKTILWSLDGNLRYIPMTALHDGKRYLAERYENVIFTRGDKERMTRAVNPAQSGTGLGSSKAHSLDIAGEKFNASALPAVKEELGRIFLGDDSRGVLAGDVLLDSQFTRSAMLAELKMRRPLVHIASHFKFQPGDEARSFLLLGDGTPFTLDEMKQQADLFSGVDLLTLSACETAAQKPDANGREVDGFAELAQRLGAGAVMASLWEVSDNSTAELMTRFYKNYRGAKPTTKADALRRAQLALLTGSYNTVSADSRQLTRETAEPLKTGGAKLKLFRPTRRAPFAHPFYWSPFILIGNWK